VNRGRYRDSGRAPRTRTARPAAVSRVAFEGHAHGGSVAYAPSPAVARRRPPSRARPRLRLDVDRRDVHWPAGELTRCVAVERVRKYFAARPRTAGATPVVGVAARKKASALQAATSALPGPRSLALRRRCRSALRSTWARRLSGQRERRPAAVVNSPATGRREARQPRRGSTDPRGWSGRARPRHRIRPRCRPRRPEVTRARRRSAPRVRYGPRARRRRSTSRGQRVGGPRHRTECGDRDGGAHGAPHRCCARRHGERNAAHENGVLTEAAPSARSQASQNRRSPTGRCRMLVSQVEADPRPTRPTGGPQARARSAPHEDRPTRPAG
jgi:hypothetical protein